MHYYLAPMEGLTTYIFRDTYHRFFGGIDKYFTPFIGNPNLNRREIDDILPEHNEGMVVVPQILTNRVDDFLSIAGHMASYGYDTVNLNLGCPAGTVVSKKRGSGFLGVPEDLDAFLAEIYEKCPLKISIKTRIGICSEEEWDEILSIYEKYPLEELIIHPRFQKQGYAGTPHVSAYQTAADRLSIPLCYNGDITSVRSQELLLEAVPSVSAIMIGRGLFIDPGLLCRIKGTTPPDKATLRAFHDELYSRYQERMSGEMPVLFKVKDVWTFMSQSFTNPEKYLKKIRKANHFKEYEAAVNALFSQEELIER